MKVRTSSRWGSGAMPDRGLAALNFDDAQGERRRVLKRMRALINAHRESVACMNVALENAFIQAVLDALIAEVERRDPGPVLKCPDPIREYARYALYPGLFINAGAFMNNPC